MSFRLPDSPASSASMAPGGYGRKRAISRPEDPSSALKRQRTSMRSLRPNIHTPSSSDLDTSGNLGEFDFFNEPSTSRHETRVLSANSSFSSYTDLTSWSRPSSNTGVNMRSDLSLMRRYSASSIDLRSTATHVETSAARHLRTDKMSIDYSVTDSNATSASPVDWSTNNIVVFARGNRVHYKNLSSNEDVGQLCKIRDNQGNLQLLSCGGKDQHNAVALCTSKGQIQIWDVSTKKLTLNWTTKGVTAMKWNGPILTVGGERGTIRHFDTRIKDTAKLKEQTKKVTRHQAKICTLAWNDEGKYLASGDKTGLVHVWDSRQNTPLDVGEMVQRRKKMQHAGAITALAWCPWQTKILASGDSAPDGSGTIRIWNISPSTAFSSNHPDKLELDAQVTSLHWSTHCKEILSTHGPGKSTPVPITPSIDINNEYFSFSNDPRPSRIANSVLIHSYPSLRNVATVAAASTNVAGSILSPNGQKALLAVPEEMKLKIWDVWGKCKELRRSNSVLSGSGIR